MSQELDPHLAPPPPGGNPPGAPPFPPDLVARLFEAMPCAAYVYDPADGRITYAGSRILKLLGMTGETVLAHAGNLFGTLLHPDDRDRAEFHRTLLWRTPDGESREVFLRFPHPDGGWRTLRLVETPFERAPDGGLRSVLGYAEDVTDLLREARRTMRHEKLFRFLHALGDEAERDWQALIQRTLDEAVRLTQSEIGYLHFVHEGEGALELFAWSSGTRRVCKAAATNHYPLERAGVWADTIRSRRPVIHNDYQTLENRRGLPEGHVPLTRHLGVPIIEGGRVVLAGGVGNKREPYDIEDARTLELLFAGMWRIAERRRAEELLRDGAARLREAERMETVARLAEGMAHALNNLLTPVQGFAEMLLESRGPRHPDRAPLEAIRKASEDATRLTGHLLSYSGRRLLRRELLDPWPFLESFALVARQLVRGNITLALLPPEGPLPKIAADPPQLEQVLHNLVLNAAEAMHEGGRITIRAFAGEIDAAFAGRHNVAPGPCLSIELRDEGRRPNADSLERLFEPFAAAGLDEGSRTLGLAAAAGIAYAHGGGIEATPNEGGGAIFTLRLPALPASDAPAPAAEGGAPRLLVVDDEPAVLHFISDSLRATGYAVEAHGDPAAAALDDDTLAGIDLLVTDVVMPGLSGIALAARLRERRPELPALFMTGYTERGLAESAAGPRDGRLYKPFGFRDLREAVAKLLAPRRG